MAVTTNKGYPLIATGAEVDNWGALANTDGWTVIDNNLAGVTTKSLTNVNVTLSASESQSAILRLTGVLTGAVQITTACVGFFFVENLTTGSFAVTITNGVSGVVAPQSQRMVMIAGATYGVRIAAQDSFPTGTRIPFNQTTVPTGWTKESSSTYNDAAIKLTTGTVATGGSAALSTTLLAARTLALNQLPDVTISVSDPGHTHPYVRSDTTYNAGGGGNSVLRGNDTANTTSNTTGITAAIDNTARGGSSQQVLWSAVKYVEFAIGTKA
jgi:hypothetical protein